MSFHDFWMQATATRTNSVESLGPGR
jgi:hypothetical protein